MYFPNVQNILNTRKPKVQETRDLKNSNEPNSEPLHDLTSSSKRKRNILY